MRISSDAIEAKYIDTSELDIIYVDDGPAGERDESKTVA